MALLVKADGTQETVEIPAGNGALAFLQGQVGGYIEIVPVCNPLTIQQEKGEFQTTLLRF